MAWSTGCLLFVTERVSPKAVERRLAKRIGPNSEVRMVVSPTVSRLHQLTDDREEERSEAEEVALGMARAIARESGVEVVEPAVGDVDAVLAMEDAVRMFHPDRVILIRPGGAGAASTTRPASE